MLSLPGGIGYVHEPFDPTDRPGRCTGTFDRWYAHISGKNQEVERCMRNALRFHYNPWPRIHSAGSREHTVIRDVLGVSYELCRCFFLRMAGSRPLVKDPLALLSAEWLHNTFGMEVVVLVRHPAAFAGSLKKGRSSFPFEDLLDQETLMSTRLAAFRGPIVDMTRGDHSFVEQAAVLWTCLYHVVREYRREYPSWQIVRYEDLVGTPIREYRDLYSTLGLNWTDRVERKISYTTDAKTDRWRDRLTASEIDFVRETTRDVWETFYTSSDW